MYITSKKGSKARVNLQRHSLKSRYRIKDKNYAEDAAFHFDSFVRQSQMRLLL